MWSPLTERSLFDQLSCVSDDPSTPLVDENTCQADPCASGTCATTPCDAGEGGCDADTECVGDLVCGANNGIGFGKSATCDVCWPVHCTNADTDGDETGLNCGGSCGACLVYVNDVTTNGTGTPDSPFNSIQAAVDDASSGDVILVAAGTYGENIEIDNKQLELYGGFSEDFTARDPLTNTSVVQGQSGSGNTFYLYDAGNTRIDGFVITGGRRKGSSWEHCGSGIRAYNGTPQITHNIIEGNSSYCGGGGVHFFYTNAGALIHRNLIRDNVTDDIGGGVSILDGAATVDTNHIIDNKITENHGAGVGWGDAIGTLSNNLIAGNVIDLEHGYGGGVLIYNGGSDVTMQYNIITNNHAGDAGSGVFVDDSAHATLSHELIYKNSSATCNNECGAGVYVDGTSPSNGSTATIDHSVIAFNGKPGCNTWEGQGICVERASIVTVTNTIIWSNEGVATNNDFWVDGTSTLNISYSSSEQTWPGTGNITGDPLFVDAANDDYHLQSVFGHWNGSGWTADGATSPCIDAGDPAAPYTDEPSPNGARANIGRYGNTAEASRSSSGLQSLDRPIDRLCIQGGGAPCLPLL